MTITDHPMPNGVDTGTLFATIAAAWGVETLAARPPVQLLIPIGTLR